LLQKFVSGNTGKHVYQAASAPGRPIDWEKIGWSAVGGAIAGAAVGAMAGAITGDPVALVGGMIVTASVGGKMTVCWAGVQGRMDHITQEEYDQAVLDYYDENDNGRLDRCERIRRQEDNRNEEGDIYESSGFWVAGKWPFQGQYPSSPTNRKGGMIPFPSEPAVSKA